MALDRAHGSADTLQTDLDDCADMFVHIAKNKSMTGQEIEIDSGFLIGMG